jgi:hypothetical protein
MKIFKFDKKVWDNGEISYTWQFGIIKNRSLLWVSYENPTSHYYSSGGFHINLSFLSSSLFGIELNNDKQSLAFEFFTEYSGGFGKDD